MSEVHTSETPGLELAQLQAGHVLQIVTGPNKSNFDELQIIQSGGQPLVRLRVLGGLGVLGDDVRLLGSCSEVEFKFSRQLKELPKDLAPGRLVLGMRYAMSLGRQLAINDGDIRQVLDRGVKKIKK